MASIKDWMARPRVSLLMAAAGALIGLAVAGASLFTTRGPSTWEVPPENAAMVNGRPILMSDYTTQLEQELGVPFLKATREQRQQVLDEMIREELFVQRGLELNEPGVDAGTRAAIVLSVQQQIAVDANAEQPSEAKLRKYYEDNRAKYESVGEMTLHDLVPARPDADMAGAAAALKAHQPLAVVMGKYGLKESGKINGSELYFAVELHIGKPLYREALKLDDGQSAGPFVDGGVPHVLVMDKNKKPVAESFEDAKDDVYNDYKESTEQALRDGEYRFLRSRSDVRIAKQNQ
jgi:hypothetical protein